MPRVGFVVIGRNEGERLRGCLETVTRHAIVAVYVDSGSTDGSQALAASMGVAVVALDMAIPFTAGRARNEGFFHLLERSPEIEYVHFIDGDCRLQDGWLEQATAFLDQHTEVALVCGVRRELHPESSIFNQLCDLEWDAPKGEVLECGGDFLIRSAVMRDVNGFNPGYIAGEEPELCFRIRQCGWKISRLDQTMTWHDANILHVSQWWKRAQRSGHAYAQVAFFHGRSPERIYVKPTISNLLWGFLLPMVMLIALFFAPLLSLLLIALYLFKILSLASNIRHRKVLDWKSAIAYGMDIMLGKLPHAVGTFQFFYRYLLKADFTIIEYKRG